MSSVVSSVVDYCEVPIHIVKTSNQELWQFEEPRAEDTMIRLTRNEVIK